MERGYLVAVVAMIATFAGLSSGLRCLQHTSLLHLRQFGVITGPACPAKPTPPERARLKTLSRPAGIDQAEIVAQVEVPVAEIESQIAMANSQIAMANSVVTKCAQARAMREAERARRDFVRMQREVPAPPSTPGVGPL